MYDSSRRLKLQLLKYVLLEMVEWHPFYIYAKIARADSKLPPYLPYYHQLELVLSYVYRPSIRVLIGDEIGLGKTLEAIIALKIIEQRIKTLGRNPKFLIVVPRILVDQWVGELERARARPIRTITNRDDVIRISNMIEPTGYYVASLQLIRSKRHAEKLAKIQWDAIVVDEAHNIGFSHDPTRSYELVHKLTRNPDTSVILVSATPHRGKPKDYLARLLLLVPSIGIDGVKELSKALDNKSFYRATHSTLLFRRTKEYVNKMEGKQIFADAKIHALLVRASQDELLFEKGIIDLAEKKLHEYGDKIWERGNPLGLLITLLLKRTSSSVAAALSTLNNMLQTLSQEYTSDHTIVEEDMENLLSGNLEAIEEEPDDIISRFIENLASYRHILDKDDLDRIKRLVNRARRIMDNGESKERALCDLIENYAKNGQKVVVFTEYRDTLYYLVDRMRKCLPRNIKIACVSGSRRGICSRDRVEVIKEQLASGEVDVVIATDVASEGLNLQVANILVNYEVPWSPIRLEQRLGRVWRLGQKRTVEAFNLYKNTEIDRAIIENLHIKILNIGEATGIARPLAGEVVKVYVSGNIMDAEKLYRGGVYLGGALPEDLSKSLDVMIAREFLTRRAKGLEDIARSIITAIHRINKILKEKDVYPTIQSIWVDNTRRALLGQLIGSTKTDIENIRDYLYHQALTLLLNYKELTGSSLPLVLKTDGIEDAIRILAWLTQSLDADKYIDRIEPGIYRADRVNHPLIILPVVIKKKGGRKQMILYKELIGVALGHKPIIYTGPELVDVIIDIIDGSIEKVNEDKSIDTIDTIISKAISQASLHHTSTQSFFYKTMSSMERLVEVVEEKIKDLDLDMENTHINSAFSLTDTVVEPLGSEALVIIPKTVSSQLGDLDFTQEKLDIEDKAIMGIVKIFEEKNGRRIIPLHRLMLPFDVISVDKTMERIKRIIEVKSHAGEVFEAKMTEREYELASILGDLYWLYIVTGVKGGKTCLYPIKNPTSRLRFTKIEDNERTYYLAVIDPNSEAVDGGYCISTLE